MTEAEWNTCDESKRMLEFLRGKTTDRKLRLFAVACCQKISHLLTDERSRIAIEVGERFADGNATKEELAAAHDAACEVERSAASLLGALDDDFADRMGRFCATKAAIHPARPDGIDYGFGRLPYDASYAFAHVARPSALALPKHFGENLKDQSTLLREIFGPLPFRQVRIDHAWLTSAVICLAEPIYQDRAFDRLPILADALEEAGCGQPDVLNHLRGDGEHCRGCWALDLVLGKS